MRTRPFGLLLVGCMGAALLGGCASRPLPKYEKPIARAPVQRVRTTAYTHSEADHIQHGRRTAAGTTLRYGAVKSAAADWSRWPLGTRFRVRETGDIYEVDDYGWALAGTNTIDFYMPSRAAMNRWGVRHVTIEHLAWGDVDRSLAILRGRSKHRHVKRMVSQIESRYASLKRPMPLPVQPSPEPAPEVRIARAEPVRVERAETVVRTVSAVPVSRVQRTHENGGSGVGLVPFNGARSR